MKIGRGSRGNHTTGPSLSRMIVFSAAASARSLSLFGLAGGVFLVALLATDGGQSPEAADQKASNLLTSAPLVASKEEDQADEHVHSVSAQSNSSNDSSSSSSQSTDLEVNGQDIPVPENGEVHRVTTENNSHTIVDVTTHTDDSSYSTDINVRSFSSSTD
jgi:hypothetical protein